MAQSFHRASSADALDDTDLMKNLYPNLLLCVSLLKYQSRGKEPSMSAFIQFNRYATMNIVRQGFLSSLPRL